ncbi:nuclear transport factor 2 family protein [Nesterenkonia sp. CL21]|uniref:nuclear transport factor 2 family protein n=1 Tax=Nesterenkonia sp. CL21 TaxID=3064894 RepID=UPI002879D674|nr:nuclear transport factor 2 family protein [Nesterenkonia sp. CL21]MDS2171853.1 nuclear transport factor 2 family protein [Nesterenkonia sp. CL21]
MTKSKLTDGQRLQRLEDIEEIKQLKARYAEALDDRFNGDKIAALFSEDGRWQVGEDQLPMQGREAIKAHCVTLAGNISWSIHYFMPSVITVGEDGQTAQGSFYILDFQTLKNEDGEDEAYMFAGTFRDQFRKVDGVWYFQDIDGKIDVVTPWTESWVNNPYIPDFFAKGE